MAGVTDDRVIVVGGGLSGLSAAHTVLERGGRVVVLDKMPFLGGNSTKATSGINGGGTRVQAALGIKDSALQFERDTAISATKGDPNAVATPLGKVLTGHSASAVEWLIDRFDLDLSLVSRLGGHSAERTHRGKERFPGMTITYALLERLEKIQEETEGRDASIITKARVTDLLRDDKGAVNGVRFTVTAKKGAEPETHELHGPVVIATGGYAADFESTGLLAQHAPQLLKLPTTNGEHCTGDGLKMALAAGAGSVDLDFVQVHPTGLVHPDEPDAPVKFLAAEALRGVGGILIDCDGHRFCDELGRRDYVTGEMQKRNKYPYRLVLNGAASKEIEWHTKHYKGRGIMKEFSSGNEVAKEMGISPDVLAATFASYNDIAEKKNDPFGKKFFHNTPFSMDDPVFHVSIVTPVVHYCMGGLEIDTEAQIVNKSGGVIENLFACGEVAGGVHGKNRLGGSSLLDCVVFGRVAGASAARAQLKQVLGGKGVARAGAIAGHLAGTRVDIAPNGAVSITVGGGGGGAGAPGAAAAGAGAGARDPGAEGPAEAAAAAPAAAGGKKEYTRDEVAKHNTEDDCWVIINGEVLDVTDFLDEHPGGKKAIMLFAGKDASEEFNMLHQAEVIPKYAPEAVIGTVAGGAGPAPAAGAAAAPSKEYTMEEVAQHNKEGDCWVVLNGQVLNVTEFLEEHPGGKKAIMLFAGKDASEEFNMLHQAEVIPKYAPEAVIGVLAGQADKIPEAQRI